ncbi:MAG: DMT family transporter [Telmatospirillum sp.]|nr:DMT family transporter [Telmatospirillum sp.]
MRSAASASFFAQLLFNSLLWAMAFPLIRVIGEDLSPPALAAVRGVLGTLALAVWITGRRQSLLPRGREWRDWIMLGLFEGAIPNILIAVSVARITTGLASMIEASCPLMVAALAHFLFTDERLGRRRLTGLLVGFAGMTILLAPAAFADNSRSALGILAAVGAAVAYAIGNLYVRAIPSADPARLALGQQMFSGLPSLALALFLEGPSGFAHVPDHAAVLLAFGLFATALPIVAYMHLLREAGPTLGSMVGYLIPVWTILAGTLLLGESVGAREILGGLVVLSGVAIVSFAKRRARPA